MARPPSNLGMSSDCPIRKYVVVQQPLNGRLDCAGLIRSIWPFEPECPHVQDYTKCLQTRRGRRNKNLGFCTWKDMKATELIINVRVVDVVLHPKDLGSVRPMRCVSLEFVCVGLFTTHQIEQCPAIHTAFRMTISCHVSGVAPWYLPDQSAVHQLS